MTQANVGIRLPSRYTDLLLVMSPDPSASNPSDTPAADSSNAPAVGNGSSHHSDEPTAQGSSDSPVSGPGEAATRGTDRATAEAESAPATDRDGSSTEEGSTGDGEAGDESETEGTESPPDVEGSQAGVSDGQAPKKRKRRRKRKKKGTDSALADKPGAAGKGGVPRAAKPATERAPFHVGEEVFGKVTAVLPHAIMVDLSGKALAIFDRTEMAADDLVPEVGERFVARVHQDGARGGLVVLTRRPLREEESKSRIEQAAKDGSLVSGLVTGVVKGGVDVDLEGLRAFAPASGLDLHPQNANFATLVGERLDFKVVQYEKAGRDVVVTRRPMLEAEAHERRKKALEVLTEGQVLGGVVRTVVEWGVFVAMPQAENLEGLIHVSEASHDPRARLAELFHPGDRFDVKITKIDERGKIWLSRKALIEDPWAAAREKYAPGQSFKGRVTRVEPFGAFVDVEGLEGLLHTADLGPKRVEDATEVLKEGDEIEVVVGHFDFRNKKLSLHPAPTAAQTQEPKQKVARNEGVKVEVVRGEQSGLHVRVMGVTGRLSRGFIPAGQTGTPRGADLRKRFPAGTVLEAKVLDVDPKRGEPKLSIKQLAEDQEKQAHREYRKQLAKEASFGTLGDLLASRLNK